MTNGNDIMFNLYHLHFNFIYYYLFFFFCRLTDRNIILNQFNFKLLTTVGLLLTPSVDYLARQIQFRWNFGIVRFRLGFQSPRNWNSQRGAKNNPIISDRKRHLLRRNGEFHLRDTACSRDNYCCSSKCMPRFFSIIKYYVI